MYFISVLIAKLLLNVDLTLARFNFSITGIKKERFMFLPIVESIQSQKDKLLLLVTNNYKSKMVILDCYIQPKKFPVLFRKRIKTKWESSEGFQIFPGAKVTPHLTTPLILDSNERVGIILLPDSQIIKNKFYQMTIITNLGTRFINFSI